MKLFLVSSQVVCLLSLLWTTPRTHRFMVVYLGAAIPATLAFQAESAWLHSWYAMLCGPVAFLRLAAGIEAAHRQTVGFRYWWRLMGAVFLLGGMFAGLAWVQHAGDGLQQFVQLRRLIQIFTGAFFLVLETFWVLAGGGWYRRCDWIAVWFGALCLNHAAVSVLAGAGGWTLDSWNSFQSGNWAIEAALYLALTVRLLTPVRSFGPVTPVQALPCARRAHSA